MSAARGPLGMIVAYSPRRVIGIGNRIPWHYPADLKRFKALTQGSTVIMGRNTYESIGRPLPNRRNLVVTRGAIAGVECVPSLGEALQRCEGPVWIIGGARLYEEGLARADFIDVTLVPDDPPPENAVCFPEIPAEFAPGPIGPHPDEPSLRLQRFERIAACVER